MKNEIESIQQERVYRIKAINFSTHGATLIYLDEFGKPITPLYNYLKPLNIDFKAFYSSYGGVEEFSRKTASPAYGMLNAGLQIYWLKKTKPHFWSRVKNILHYPQYLSYLFSQRITADFTSIGAHTALWDFDNMRYHQWLEDEKIDLPEPFDGQLINQSIINGEEIDIGCGLHDSSSSIVPLLRSNKNFDREFVLLSTGTWIICMNPFSKERLSQSQLKNNCLCYLSPDRQQIKSSMQFLGRIHEVNASLLATHFGVDKNYYLNLVLNKSLCSEVLSRSKNIFLAKEETSDFEKKIKKFENYELAYYQLIYEISLQVYEGVRLILDTTNNLKDVYISGGFNKNHIFVEYLTQMMPDQEIKFPKGKYASALGAAIMMSDSIS